MHRSHVVLALASIWLAPLQASVDGVPIPAEAGEFYYTVRAGGMDVERSYFRAQQTYVDDSGVPPLGLVSLVNPQGFLVNLKVDEKREWLPEIEFGYGLAGAPFDERFDGVMRVSAAFHGHKFKSSAYAPVLVPPSTGFSVDDGMGGMMPTGLVATYNAISGASVGTITDGFLNDRPITDVNLAVDMKQAGVELMLHFDERWEGWEFSRGAGLTYSYQTEDMLYTFDMPDLASVDMGQLGGDYSFTEDYDIKSHIVGLKLGFSIGRPLFGGLGAFINGSFTPGVAFGDLEAVQNAPCQTPVCNLSTIWTRDTIYRQDDRVAFAYNVRAGGGLSWRPWKLRLTGQGGYRHGMTHYEARKKLGGEPVRLKMGTSGGFWANLGLTISI